MTVCFSQSEGSKTIKENQNGNKSERARVQFSHSVISNSLRPHGLQHARLPCPSPSSWSLLKLLSIELDSKGVREKRMSVFLQSNLGVISHHFCCIIIIRSSPQSVQFSSVAQSCPTLRPHELQHTGPPCRSPTPRVHPNPCPLSR